MLVTEGRVIPNVEVVRPDGSVASLSTYTAKDERLVRDSAGNGGPGVLTLEQIAEAKQMIALDASDGKLDLKVNGLALETPRYTIFWSDNSAAILLRALLEGGRSLRVNGKEVEVTQAYKSWVMSTQFLESAPGTGGNIG